MNFINRRTAVLGSLAVFFLFLSALPADNPKKNQIILELMMNGLKQMHYDKHTINNEFSENVFELYIENLDYGKRFLLQEDVEELKKFKYKIDDEIKAKTFELFEAGNKVYFKRIKEVEKYFRDALKKPFDFTKDEVFESDPEKREYAKTKKELKKRWFKLMKYNVMTKLATKLDIQEQKLKDEDTSYTEKSFEKLEKEARKAVLKTYNDWHHRLMRTNEQDMASMYFNAIASYYDPHTRYFPPEDKENFDISMSGKLEGIGATLSQPNAYIKVERIVPGSPCWKQGDLEVGDLILKVAQGDEEPVDVVDMRLDKAIKMIRGKKGTEVRLTVKKQDGTIHVIPIIRDEVIIEETYAKSTLIVNPQTGERIGYIYLPKFYADFKDENGPRCSRDVKNEIIKLKEHDIDGLIIDLRNNGGGSLEDVVNIMGLLIDKGPVVQIKARYASPRILKDRNRGTLYNGALAVMVNEFSASASEILAAAVQDYQRGIIVGSEHTFGKGTVQRFFPFDRMLRGYEEYKPLGDLKLTTQKFYRVNGGATQLEGVSSDIVLPDAYAHLDMGEKDLDNPMPWDEILKADYKPFNGTINIKKLRKESQKRTQSDTSFNYISRYADFMKEARDKSKQSLNLEKYRQEQKHNSKRSKRYKNVIKRPSDFVFRLSHTDSLEIYSDSIKTARFEDWHKSLKNDIYINETAKIVSSMQ